MAGISRKEFEKLDDENRVLCQKLSDAEMELTRKDEALKTENIRCANTHTQHATCKFTPM